MDNNFMHTLARKLLLCVSYPEMKDILDDYWGFANECSLSENPKQILASIGESKNRMYITYAILALYAMINAYLFMSISEHHNFSAQLEYFLLFFMSIFFSLFSFIFFSRQVKLMSKFYRVPKYEKKFNYTVNIGIFLLVIFYSVHFHFEIEFVFLDTVTTVAIMALIISVTICGHCFFTKSLFYYFPMCNGFATLCFIFQIGVARSILRVEEYPQNIGLALICYLMQIFVVCIFYFLFLKKDVKPS